MSFIENLKFIEERIFLKIMYDLQEINNNYFIVNCSKLSKDKGYIIKCNNGFKGSIQDFEENKKTELNFYIKKLRNLGIKIKDKNYYIDTQKININNLKLKDIEINLIN